MKSFLEKYNITLPVLRQQLLKDFVEAVHRENSLYNLTGHRDMDEIADDLVCRSIAPLKSLNVPRGTFAADLGSGAGVPGIPLAIAFPETSWTLFDSNNKKVAFINGFAKTHGLANVKGVAGRIEDMIREGDFRLKFDFVVSRAMAGPYICSELGAPLLKKNGFLYLYSRLIPESLPEAVFSHCLECGLVLARREEREKFGIDEEGLMFVKNKETPKYIPRRFAVIKKAAAKAEE